MSLGIGFIFILFAFGHEILCRLVSFRLCQIINRVDSLIRATGSIAFQWLVVRVVGIRDLISFSLTRYPDDLKWHPRLVNVDFMRTQNARSYPLYMLCAFNVIDDDTETKQLRKKQRQIRFLFQNVLLFLESILFRSFMRQIVNSSFHVQFQQMSSQVAVHSSNCYYKAH